MRLLIIAVALVGVLLSQGGCALVLTGHLIGDSMAKDKRIAACRTNLQTTNNARIAEHKDPFPDQCQ